MSLVLALLGALRASVRTRTNLALENLALRQQLVLLRRRSKRSQFGRLNRLFWVWLSHQWAGWREALHLVRRETVIRRVGKASALSGPGVTPQAGRSLPSDRIASARGVERAPGHLVLDQISPSDS